MIVYLYIPSERAAGAPDKLCPRIIIALPHNIIIVSGIECECMSLGTEIGIPAHTIYARTIAAVRDEDEPRTPEAVRLAGAVVVHV